MRTIAQLQDGDTGRIRGRVRGARPELLLSKLGQKRCVYWDMRQGLDAPPEERESQAFWLEDATGKVLIPRDGVVIEARGERRKALVERATADIHAVTERIRQLKQELRSGTASGEVMRERQHLAKVATLLCAIRAHARGNVHNAASLKHQEEFIERNKHLVEGQDLGADTIEMMVQRFEVVLCEGDEVEAEGLFRVEPMPPDIGGAQGYRERPACLTLRPDRLGDARIVGVGQSAPIDEEELPDPFADPKDAKSAKKGSKNEQGKGEYPPPHEDPIVRATAFIVGVAVAVYYLFF